MPENWEEAEGASLDGVQWKLRTWLNEPGTVVERVAKAAGIQSSTLHKFRKGVTKKLSGGTTDKLIKLKVHGLPPTRKGKPPGPARGRNPRAVKPE